MTNVAVDSSELWRGTWHVQIMTTMQTTESDPCTENEVRAAAAATLIESHYDAGTEKGPKNHFLVHFTHE
jgi:hypothetical protein